MNLSELLHVQGASTCLNSLWYVDSGGSRHMTGYKSLLSNLKVVSEGDVSFGNNSTGKIVGTGDVLAGKIKFENVKLVDNLKFNLLSVSQMCDKGYGCYFTKTNCKVIEPNLQAHISKLISDHAILNAKRNGNVYMLDLSFGKPTSNATCFLTRASNRKQTYGIGDLVMSA